MQLLEEQENKTEKIDILVTAVQELSLARSMDQVTKIVRTAARKLAGADGATFVLREQGLCYYVDEDAITPLWKGQKFPMSACISGWSMLTKKQAIIEDIYKDERIPIDAYQPTFVKSLVMVPIRTMEPIGAIGSYWAHQYVPPPEDIKLLQSLADITAVTIENVQVYQELEQRVKDRTEELEKVNKELESFSYTISHDLQAPLRAVSGYVDMLKEDYENKPFDEEGKRIADRIQSNVGDMKKLIEGLLEFFRMGRKELTFNPVEMKPMVETICHLMKEINPTQNILFKIGELPVVMGEESLLRQAWMNLLSNAVKYSSKKEESVIEIGCEKKEKEFVFYVKDNGDGFDMSYYNKLFGVFQRLHHKSDFEGTGIGLATVQKIIVKHKGKVWAEGKPKEGAVFYFSLPLI